MPDGSSDTSGDRLPERLEQMKSEFVAAQRRRQTVPVAAARPDDSDAGPTQAGPADGRLSGIAAERP